MGEKIKNGKSFINLNNKNKLHLNAFIIVIIKSIIIKRFKLIDNGNSMTYSKVNIKSENDNFSIKINNLTINKDSIFQLINMLKIFEFLIDYNCGSIIDIKDDDDSDYLSDLTDEEKHLVNLRKKNSKVDDLCITIIFTKNIQNQNLIKE